MNFLSIVALFLFLWHHCHKSVAAWDITPLSSKRASLTSRKQVLQIGVGWLLSTSVAEAASTKSPKYLSERGSENVDLSPCNDQPMKKNCWSTEDKEGRRLEPWIPPPGQNQDIAKELEETIGVYPQEGYLGVDQGGWKLAEKSGTSGSGVTYFRYEFTSGRYKFVDDVEIRVEDGAKNGKSKVCARSSSREGIFDDDVNKIRLNYIMSLLANKGWKVKEL
mmetsp:Transcript_37978/g.43372  ORF Transcript_37978/g.43372 Transcript_37978/m.43372 type:complete len:221 (-) Transcript_37978:363-1025(-)